MPSTASSGGPPALPSAQSSSTYGETAVQNTEAEPHRGNLRDNGQELEIVDETSSSSSTSSSSTFSCSDASRHHHHRYTSHRYLPILTSLFAPVAVLLAIPGLIEKWYVKVDDSGRQYAAQPDPSLLVAAEAVILACAIGACVALATRLVTIRRMLEAAAVSLALMVLQVTISVSALTIFAVEHNIDDGYVLSTAWYTTLASASISLVNCGLLVVDVVLLHKARKCAPKDGALHTGGGALMRKETTVLLIWMAYLTYIALTALVSKFLYSLTFVDALYAVTQTILTAGLGDISPKTDSARVWTVFYSTGGIILLGVLVVFARETILETTAMAAATRSRRMVRRAGRAVARKLPIASDGKLAHVARKLRANDGQSGRTARDQSSDQEVHKGKLSKEVEEVEEAIDASNPHVRMQGAILLLLFIIFWVFGALAFSKIEKWSFGIALYFWYITFSTIGYGDYAPITQAGRAFYVGWSLFGVIVMTVIFSLLSEIWTDLMRSTIGTARLLRIFRLGRRSNRPDQGGNSGQDLERSSHTSSHPPEGETSSELGSLLSDISDLAREIGSQSRNAPADNFAVNLDSLRRFRKLLDGMRTAADDEKTGVEYYDR